MLQDRYVHLPERDITLHVRVGEADGPAFLLSHGLSSNCLTWEPVALRMHQTGYTVVTVDQRGHGLSQKPAAGYSCTDVAADMAHLIRALELEAPIFVGQSWGGNVALCLAAAYPQLVKGLGFIDGGFIDLQDSFGSDWEATQERLRPPPLAGTPVDALRQRLRQAHPDWTPEGIEHTLGNFAVDDAGRVQPRLSAANHLRILRGLWEMRPRDFWPQVQCATLICPALKDEDVERRQRKKKQVAQAEAGLPEVATIWFEGTDHDIHVHRPVQLAERLMQEARMGLWAV